MALAGHGFTVEVGVGDGLDHRAAVIGGVSEPHYISHIKLPGWGWSISRDLIHVLLLALAKKAMPVFSGGKSCISPIVSFDFVSFAVD